MATINGYDFHCHVDLHPDPPALIKRCEKNRVAVLAVTTTPKAWAQNLFWTRDSTLVHSSVGLHPELVGERYSEIDLLEELISQCRLVGEVGLDGSPQYRSSYTKQKDVFMRVLKAAEVHGGRVLTIHSRRSVSDVLSLIKAHATPGNVTCILHWFSGSIKNMSQAVEAGCYFSVNQRMLDSQQGCSLIQSIPLNRLLTETDAPFIEINGKPSDPTRTKYLVSAMAQLRRESTKELQEQIHENAKQVFAAAGISVM